MDPFPYSVSWAVANRSASSLAVQRKVDEKMVGEQLVLEALPAELGLVVA